MLLLGGTNELHSKEENKEKRTENFTGRWGSGGRGNHSTWKAATSLRNQNLVQEW